MGRNSRLLIGPLLVLGAFSFSTARLHAQKSMFTVGTAVGTQLSNCANDPGGVSGNCWGLNVSCPNVTAISPYDVTVKVTAPVGQSLGTIIFMTGGGGIYYYDTYFTYGTKLINDVVSAGYTAAQIVFDNSVAGWLTGPAGDGNGPISLACLPATAMEWVYHTILTSGTPLCATGNSGGSAAIAYALSQYGLGTILTLAEATSGPEFSRLDYGCSPRTRFSACALCGSGTQYDSFGLNNAEEYLDPAYTGVVNRQPTGPCSEDVNGSQKNVGQLHHDSILSDNYPPQLSFPTQVRVLFGGADKSGGAIPEGLNWASFVTSPATIVCVPSAGHDMANDLSGASQIESDLVSYCKLP
jgi:hypothetical protein